MTNFSISSFAVEGLYGETTIRMPIIDNRLVVVGVNGLGKSTFLNIFYFFISRQWIRLLEYDFSRVTALIDGTELSITKDELNLGTNIGVEATSRLGSVLTRAFSDLNFRRALLDLRNASPGVQQVRLRHLGVSLSLSELNTIQNYFAHSISEAFKSEEVSRVSQFLETHLDAQILYLPTYRRIEKDLNIVLPDLEDELQRLHDRRRFMRSDRDTSFLELVEFGMEDVNRSIHHRLNQQKEAARAELSNLAGSYLRDVLRGEGETYEPSLISTLSDAAIDFILNRVEENTLSESDKARLRSVINTIRGGGSLKSSEKYVAHFFVKLFQAQQALDEAQIPMASFVDVCNKYLDDKRFIYDDVNYDLNVVRNKKRIELSALSSGEKQIVSLFSQLYIGGAPQYIIIIDEPELSLSVNWQKTLLPDLESSGHCAFIAAVTHSPFIFDNDFEKYTVDMSQFVSVTNV